MPNLWWANIHGRKKMPNKISAIIFILVYLWMARDGRNNVARAIPMSVAIYRNNPTKNQISTE